MKNINLPKCPFDGKICLNPQRGCFQSLFGVLTSDGKEEVFWVCPRFERSGVKAER